ncbi:uncharacterized protein [Nicotiana sylvestris]|uniref:uncharacterized protein n=1 Tax=Nicotiana sylvestris TaxID=4096 RepID=UPI00388CA62C
MGTILVCSRDALVLFYLGSIYSYVSSYFASYLVVPRDSLSAPIYVSTLVVDSIMVDRVYRSCMVVTRDLETRVNILLLDMVDFDVILEMDWLSPYHAILDYHAKYVTLALPGWPHLKWRRTPGHSTSKVISYMKAQPMVDKGCFDYLAYVHNPSVEVPSMDFVPVVREFSEVFPLTYWGCHQTAILTFALIFLHILCPPKLNELKEQLQDLLDKGFIRPSVSPWDAPVLSVKKKNGSMRMCIDYR